MAVDYDKIAKSAGGVDYDSLAASLGSVQPPEGAPIPVSAHTRKPRSRVGASILGQAAGALTSPLGPASIPIAGAAGAAGEQLQQGLEMGIPAITPFGAFNPSSVPGLVTGELPNPEQVALQGSKQAGLQSLGGMVGMTAENVSKPLMELAVKATPEVAQTAIREGIKTTQAGFNKVMSKLGQYGSRTLNIARQASRSTKPFNVPDLARQAYEDIFPKIQVSMTGEEKAALKQSIETFLGENPAAKATALRLHKLKQAADTAARAIYNLPENVKATPAQQAVAGFYQAFADRARASLNAAVRGYEESNEPTEALIRLKDAVWPLTKKEMSAGARILQATLRPGLGTVVGAAGGAYAAPEHRALGGIAGGAAGALGASPPGASTLALALNSPIIQFLLQRGGAGIGGAVTP